MDSQAERLSQATLAVLAGGEGSRMGQPKGALRLRGRAILSELLDRFRWPGPTLLVTAPGREHPPEWDRFDREAVDPVAAAGPLRGLLTALEATHTPLLVVVTVDMPGIGTPHIAWLVEQLVEPLFGVMCSRQGEKRDAGEQIEPFPCVFRREAAAWVAAQMAAGVRSTYRLSQTDRVRAVPAPPAWGPRVWTNLNRPPDVERWDDANHGGEEER